VSAENFPSQSTNFANIKRNQNFQSIKRIERVGMSKKDYLFAENGRVQSHDSGGHWRRARSKLYSPRKKMETLFDLCKGKAELIEKQRNNLQKLKL
jgi:hypothetical protein